MDKTKHWQKVYNEKDITKVSWHQAEKSLSFDLITEFSNIQAKIIDVGCGATLLIDNLLDKGYKNIIASDISQAALDIVKNRVGDKVEYICDDLLNLNLAKKVDIWHDRAVLHFLTTEGDCQKYTQVLSQNLKVGGVAIIATFAPDKVRKCSDLATKSYDKNSIMALLGDGFSLLKSLDENHHTPGGDTQLFNYFCVRKLAI